MEPMTPEDPEPERWAEPDALPSGHPDFDPEGVQRLLRAVYGEPEPACTCVLGNPDHAGDCFCTTSIMECGLHRYTRLGLLEARLVRQHQERLR